MSGTLQTPTVGEPNSSEDPKIATAVSTLNGLLDGSNKLDGAQLSAGSVAAAALASNSVTNAKLDDDAVDSAEIADGAIDTAHIADTQVTDAKLASPNNGVYRTLLATGCQIGGGASSATVYLGWELERTSAALATPPAMIYLDDADYAVAGKTTKLRLRAQLFTGSTSPSIIYGVGLYPLSSISAGTFTVGSQVTGSGVGFATPSTNSMNQANSGDFTFPSDGYYIIGVGFTGNHTEDIAVMAQLQVRAT